MEVGAPETRSILVMLTVPEDWPHLTVSEVARKLRANEPHLSRFLAREIIRWGKTDAMDKEGLKRFVASLPEPEEAEDG